MTTLGFYFAGLSNEEANEMRGRLNDIAARMGYTAKAGATTGEGNAAALLAAIADGEVLLSVKARPGMADVEFSTTLLKDIVGKAGVLAHEGQRVDVLGFGVDTSIVRLPSGRVLYVSNAALSSDDIVKDETMKAQQLYDIREEFGHIDGMQLHRLFQELTGDPSPSGRTEIDTAELSAQIGQWNEDMDAFIKSVLEG